MPDTIDCVSEYIVPTQQVNARCYLPLVQRESHAGKAKSALHEPTLQAWNLSVPHSDQV